MSKRGRKGKKIIDDWQIRSTQSVFALEIENPLQENSDTNPTDEGSSNCGVKSPVRDLMDYLDPETKISILTKENRMNLQKKYDIPYEYEMLVSGLEDRVSEPP